MLEAGSRPIAKHEVSSGPYVEYTFLAGNTLLAVYAKSEDFEGYYSEKNQ